MTSRSRSKSESGFTLIEVLIVMAILAFMSLGIYQAVTESFRLRDKLSNEGDFYNTIRLAMGLVQRDVELMYSPTILLPPKKNPQTTSANQNPSAAPTASRGGSNLTDESGIPAATAAELNQTGNFWLAAIDKTGLRPSRFIGSDKKISFVSASHIRMYKDAPESDLAKVTYEFRKDEEPPPGLNIQDSSVLVKTESTNVFDIDDNRDKAFVHSYPILHGITKFNFRFYKKDKDNWYTTWDSDNDDFKGEYPDMIEISIEVRGPTSLFFEGKYRFRPEVPLHGINPSF